MSLIDLWQQLPAGYKEFGLVIAVMSLVEVMPVKINPWKWIKAFIELPQRVEDLERDVNNDRAYKWRSMILSRADHVRRGDKLSKERWGDTIETIDRYESYCELMERIDNDHHFVNGKAKNAISYLKKKYSVVFEANDFLVGEDYIEEEIL